MLRTKVSAELIPMMSETGETSSLAAILGKTALPKAEAPARMWVKLNFLCTSRTRGVILSATNPL